MSALPKIALFAVVGFVVLMLFVPSFRQILSRISRSSETLVVPSEGGERIAGGRQLELVTLLGFDAIPAILNPKLVTASEAEADMDPDEQVLGCPSMASTGPTPSGCSAGTRS